MAFGLQFGILTSLLLLALSAEESQALSIHRSNIAAVVDSTSWSVPIRRSRDGTLALKKGSRGRRGRGGKSKGPGHGSGARDDGQHHHTSKAHRAKQGETRKDHANSTTTTTTTTKAKQGTGTGTGPWHDLPFGQFRPAVDVSGGTTTTTGNKTMTPLDDPTGLAPAESSGVSNALGKGFDPQFLTIQLQNGSQLFVTPDVNFGLQTFLRASINLDDIYRDEAKMHVTYNYSSTVYPKGVGTEAADIVRWDGERYLYTVSATADDTMRALLSRTDDVLGEYEDLGRITHNGTALTGFDPHVIVHPNGKRYLIWSNHEYVQIVQLASANTAVGPIVNLVSYGVNTEAPTSWFYPNRHNRSQTLNLAYAEGNFYQSNYNTRVLFLDVSQDPLDVRQWYQRGASTLSSSSSRGVFGPGSGSFFKGPDGRAWFGYGAFDKQDGADDGKNDRFVRVQVAPADEQGVWIPTSVVKTPKTYKNTRCSQSPCL